MSQQNSMIYKDLVHEYFYPEKVDKISDGHYFIMFKKTYFAKLELHLKSKTNNTITVKIGEKSLDDKSVDDNPPERLDMLKINWL